MIGVYCEEIKAGKLSGGSRGHRAARACTLACAAAPPFHISLSGVRVEGSTAAEPPRWRLRAGGCTGSCVGRSCGRRLRWRRRRERKSTEPVDCLCELTFPDGPIRHADGGWYDPRQTQLRRCALCTAPTARPPFSRPWTMGRKSGSCSLQTGVSRRKRWISCA